jgi:ABC-2 type transport system permease protein
MSKIGLIFQREYLTRVQKKSFIVMTILTPLLFGMMIMFVAWFSSKKGDAKVIEVLDNSGLFQNKFVDSESIKFVYIGGELDEAKGHIVDMESFGLLFIPEFEVSDPKGFQFFSEQNPSFDLVNSLNDQISAEIRLKRIAKMDLNEEKLKLLDVKIDTKTFNISNDIESNAGVNFGIGYVTSFLIYIFIFLYGSQVMRGVIEEKSSRIVEVIISSVKPFQLMLGKILGVATVGLTQFLIWIILMFGVMTAAGTYMAKDQLQSASSSMGSQEAQILEENLNDESKSAELFKAIQNVPIFKIATLFLFYFLGGYLLYAALFAMVGSAVDSEADSQQFMIPITIPLLLAIFSLAPVLEDPNGQLAFWLSMVPFTSPIVMMCRIAFGVPFWQIGLSMILLIGGFIFTTWFASRVYRVGILMHGTKVNYKILLKWFFQN